LTVSRRSNAGVVKKMVMFREIARVLLFLVSRPSFMGRVLLAAFHPIIA
jgi:hypothetical protein